MTNTGWELTFEGVAGVDICNSKEQEGSGKNNAVHKGSLGESQTS